MAKTHFDRLRKRYKAFIEKGTKYVELLKQILLGNVSSIQEFMFNENEKKWNNLSKKLSKKTGSRLVLPVIEDVIPKESIQIIKTTENGKKINDKLKDQLVKNLKDTLFKFDEESYITQRGTTAGRINPKLIDQFEKEITKTFSSYTKKDKAFNMPKNIHTIAVTEVRSTINGMKDGYIQKMMDQNPDIDIKKKWIHNRRLSKVPRRGHIQVAKRKAIPYNEYFDVPHYIERGGKLIKMKTTKMKFPHDPVAGPEHNANCNCDYDIIVTKKKTKR